MNIKNTGYFDDLSLHLTNTHRGVDFLRKQGIEANILSEYIDDQFLLHGSLVKFQKEDIVAYNPKKGYRFTANLLRCLSNYHIRSTAIENMSREQVIETLQKAKVYIDFGNHPGKDRLPREAAMLGCCVITGKRGSAGFYEDVPIPDKFKFKEDRENIDKIVHTILKCLKDYDIMHLSFISYKECIKREKWIFIHQINSIFKIEKECFRHEK